MERRKESIAGSIIELKKAIDFFKFDENIKTIRLESVNGIVFDIDFSKIFSTTKDENISNLFIKKNKEG